MKKQIPNILTSLNVIFGVLSILFSVENNLVFAAWFIIIAAIFDFFDGFSARLLNAYSPVGKELDSLADLISFGVAPALIVFNILKNSQGVYTVMQTNILPYIALLLPLAAAWRLAIFNVKSFDKKYFLGLPVPANALFFISIPLILNANPDNQIHQWVANVLSNGYALSVFVIMFSFLMVSKLPLFSLKISKDTLKSHVFQLIYLVIVFVLLILFRYVAIPMAILLYVLTSVFTQRIYKNI